MKICEKIASFLQTIHGEKTDVFPDAPAGQETFNSGYMRYCKDQLDRCQEVYGFDGYACDCENELDYYASDCGKEN